MSTGIWTTPATRPGDADHGHGNAWISCRTDAPGEIGVPPHRMIRPFPSVLPRHETRSAGGDVLISAPLPVMDVYMQQR